MYTALGSYVQIDDRNYNCTVFVNTAKITHVETGDYNKPYVIHLEGGGKVEFSYAPQEVLAKLGVASWK